MPSRESRTHELKFLARTLICVKSQHDIAADIMVNNSLQTMIFMCFQTFSMKSDNKLHEWHHICFIALTFAWPLKKHF